ncbi:MAG: glycosyltransferase family 4 protein [Betaproteobacteria bacterium]|nr:glycosyltransferase family 4 protein [Betaproteobacteria bacterium]
MEKTLPPMVKVGLRVCFLSRIAPMKNLDYALKVLAHVKAPVQFHIYGPKELPAYWEECEALIRQLPPNVLVTYGGSVENSQVRSVIAMHDLFFVPSRGENFGHVFMEALSAGVPILVSDKTPWRDLKEQKLGWDISLEQLDEFVRAVEEAAGFDALMRAEMRTRCVSFARDKAEDSEALI